MTTYYIDPSGGSDAADGLTTSTPKQSVSFISSAGSHTFYIKRGTTATISGGSGEIAPATGTSDAARTYIGAYGTGERPIIDGSGLVDRSTIWGFSSRNFITVEDLDVIGTSLGVSTGQACIKFTGTDIVVRRCIARNISGTGNADFNGIHITGLRPTVEDCIGHDLATDGIWLSPAGSKAIVRRNRIYRIAQDGRVAGDCVQITGASNDFEVVDNYLDHSDLGVKQTFIISGGGAGSGGIFARNVCIMSTDTTLSTTTNVHVDQPGVVIRGNRLIGGAFGVQVNASPAGVIVAGNYVEGAVLGGINDVLGAVGMRVEGNTVSGCGGYGITLPGTSASRTAKNNCIVECAGGLSAPSSVAVANNSYFGITGSTYAGGTSAATGDITADPILTSGGRPMVGSPLLGAGAHINYQRDADGKQRPNPPAIGAYDVATLRQTPMIDPSL